MDFYERRFRFKATILGIALLIGGASLYYTFTLVSQLALREKKLIELYANAYKALASSTETDNLDFLLNDVITANQSVPVILTDDHNHYQGHRNINIPDKLSPAERDSLVAREIRIMAAEYPPITVEVYGIKQYIYYRNSDLITQLRYYPLVQLIAITVFGLVSYMAFSNSRRSEQNRVWVGLAKETAHQLGTPISGLLAWMELLRSDNSSPYASLVDDMEKDVKRIQMVSERFSMIGSEAKLERVPLQPLLQNLIDYLKPRTSQKVSFDIETLVPDIQAIVNAPLFEWVIENICKNAIDAMEAKGSLTITLRKSARGSAIIDIKDTGKGIPKNQWKKIFEPGFSTKQRGWGLGLTLVKRIITDYHKGKIFVYRSEIGKGTTFRIIIPSQINRRWWQ